MYGLVFVFLAFVVAVFWATFATVRAKFWRDEIGGRSARQNAISALIAVLVTALICGGTCALFLSNLQI